MPGSLSWQKLGLEKCKTKPGTTKRHSAKLKINETKTELCLFYRNDHAPVTITVNNINLTSKSSINVLGVQFDSKLSWSDQVNKSINKAKKAYHAINPIKKYFNCNELKELLTSNYYSMPDKKTISCLGIEKKRLTIEWTF